MGGQSSELKGPDLAQGVAFDSLKSGEPLLGHSGGEAVVVVRQGDDVFATGATCSHYGGPLAEGLVVDGTIRCPWHHACFDLKTGQAVWGAALLPVPCYEVERQGALVKIGKKRVLAPKDVPHAQAPKRVVILGAGAAGAACAEMLRAEGYTGAITMIGAEQPGPVDRPNLSKDFLAGTAPEEWAVLGGAERYREIGVELMADDPVMELNVRDLSVHLKSGRWLSYDALLFATGGEPRRLPIPGADSPHVLTLRSLGDSKAIIERAKSGARAVVIGASFIGLEVAASLRQRGVSVDVVAPDQAPLAGILGAELGALVKSLHEEKGVKFHLGRKPTAIEQTAVTLDDGSKLEADFVVLGVGVRPRTELAEKAGLKVDNGVVVDQTMQSSVPSVYAAGDVARYPDVGGASARIEHWVVAVRQGQAAARAMLGRKEPYKKPPFFWSAHYDLTISYVGNGAGFTRHVVHGDLSARDALVAYYKDDQIVAIATLGRDHLRLEIEAAMEQGDQATVVRLVASQ
ncbi:MAG TPA: FAD-dependent oxidoreductase [Polyangiaceae bacterium]|nr:FAD-dependent oxidoreductase [Polyangiaceae bacterium]